MSPLTWSTLFALTAAQETLKIGVVGPFACWGVEHGAPAFVVQRALNNREAWVWDSTVSWEDFNIELLFEDSGCNTVGGVTAARALTQRGVHGLIMDHLSSTASELRSFLSIESVFALSTAAVGVDLAASSDWVSDQIPFGRMKSGGTQAHFFIGSLIKLLEAKRGQLLPEFAFVYGSDEMGLGTFRDTMASLEDVVGHEIRASGLMMPYGMPGSWPDILRRFGDGHKQLRVFVLIILPSFAATFIEAASAAGMGGSAQVWIALSSVSMPTAFVGFESRWKGMVIYGGHDHGALRPAFDEAWQRVNESHLPEALRTMRFLGQTLNRPPAVFPQGELAFRAADAVLVMARAFNELLKLGHSDHESLGRLLYTTAFSRKRDGRLNAFTGLTGPVAFTETGERLEEVDFWFMTGTAFPHWSLFGTLMFDADVELRTPAFHANWIFNDGTTMPPRLYVPDCPGGYSSHRSEFCVACPVGTYSFGGIDEPCQACLAGYYCPVASAQALKCPAGSSCAAGVGNPSTCAAGTSSQEGASTCAPCPPETFAADGATSCEKVGWVTGEWSKCSQPCGPSGVSTRTRSCRVLGSREEVADASCDPNKRPPTENPCNRSVTCSTTIVAIALALSIGSLLLLGALFMIYRKHSKLVAREVARRAARIQRAIVDLSSVSFPMVVVSQLKFVTHGQLLSYEELTDLDDRPHWKFLHTYEQGTAFVSTMVVTFISHQWLGCIVPDIEGVHYRSSCHALQQLVQEACIEASLAWLWMDYCCIPQKNIVSKSQAIKSLPVYASLCSYFVILAPDAVHADFGGPCNADTYQRRGWCRLEQLCRFSFGGADTMFLYTDRLAPLQDMERWYVESCHVFDGDFTKESDKLDVVDVVLGIWAFLLYAQTQQHRSSSCFDVIHARKDRIFPSQYFGAMIEDLEGMVNRLEQSIHKSTTGPSAVRVLEQPDLKTDLQVALDNLMVASQASRVSSRTNAIQASSGTARYIDDAVQQDSRPGAVHTCAEADVGMILATPPSPVSSCPSTPQLKQSL